MRRFKMPKLPEIWEVEYFLEIRWPSAIILILDSLLLWFWIQTLRGVFWPTIPHLGPVWTMVAKVFVGWYVFGLITSVLDWPDESDWEQWRLAIAEQWLSPIFVIVSPLASTIRGRFQGYNAPYPFAGPFTILLMGTWTIIEHFTRRVTE